MYPYVTPTVPCFEKMRTGIPAQYTYASFQPYDGNKDPIVILWSSLATARTFKVIIQYIAGYCGFANTIVETPELTFINQSYISADFVSFDSISVNNPSSLKLSAQ